MGIAKGSNTSGHNRLQLQKTDGIVLPVSRGKKDCLLARQFSWELEKDPPMSNVLHQLLSWPIELFKWENTLFCPQSCSSEYRSAKKSIQKVNAPIEGLFWGDQFRTCWFWHSTVAVPTLFRRDFGWFVSLKSLRNSQQDSTRVLSAHEAVMEVTVLKQCRHPHEHTPGVMSLTGDITPPGPSRQRRGKATASTDSDQNKIKENISKRNKEK